MRYSRATGTFYGESVDSMSRSKTIAAAMIAVLSLLGCGAAVDDVATPAPDDSRPDIDGPTVQDAIAESPVMAIVDYGWLGNPDTSTLDRYAKADIVVLDMANFWADAISVDIVQELKTRNPNVRVIGYVNAHDCWLTWENSATSYFADWYTATRPYWSYTTTGDTMQAWPGKVLVNILDPACRSAMIGVLASHLDVHHTRIDGLFWDHFNSWLWVPDVIPGVSGNMDLDGDGVAHRTDLDEQAAYRAASDAMVSEARARLGTDLIQIANGNRATTDPAFAALLDGAFYENFPEVGVTGGSYAGALDPASANNLLAVRSWLRTENGGPWVILSNKFQFNCSDGTGGWVNWREAEFVRVIAMLTDTAVSYHAEPKTTWGWPAIDLDLGAPMSAMHMDGQVYEREFERGKVSLRMKSGLRPVPFDFAIVQAGDTVQTFSLP